MWLLKDEQETLYFGAQLAQAVDVPAVIYLQGNLGAGKTTMARGFLRGLGYADKVKSPTYTLVESYELSAHSVHHFDLYRLQDPQELDFIGIQDYFSQPALCLVEWSENGKGILPVSDLTCCLEWMSQGRRATLDAYTPRGRIMLDKLRQMRSGL